MSIFSVIRNVFPAHTKIGKLLGSTNHNHGLDLRDLTTKDGRRRFGNELLKFQTGDGVIDKDVLRDAGVDERFIHSLPSSKNVYNNDKTFYDDGNEEETSVNKDDNWNYLWFLLLFLLFSKRFRRKVKGFF